MKEFDEKKNSKNIGKKLESNLSKNEIISKAFEYHLQGNIAEASKYYQFFINKGFKDHRIFLNSGEILKNLGRLEEAEVWIRRAISLKPDYTIAHNNLGNILRAKNKLKEAESCYCKAITLNPDFTKAYYNLSTLTSTDEKKIWQKKLFSESFLKNKSKNDQFNIFFARANILHKKKNFKESAKCLKLANQLKILIYPSNSDSLIKKSKLLLIESNRADLNLNKEKNNLQTIFIVGMPRSGTTLAESIISMNSKVLDLGETNAFERSFKEWKEKKGKFDLYDLYMQRINKKIKSYITTNKWLYNYQYAGIIAKQIPNSKIIYCYRNPLDNILSIYRTNFEKDNEYSSSLIDCANIYLDHRQIMNEYTKRFPENIYDLNYDLLVKNPDKEIKSLINWLGWKWNKAYLKPHLSTRSVFTASDVQIRSKINSKSIGGWKNYKEMLKPAIKIITKDDEYKNL
ncbi:MAG: sulfotransferase [Prochlorococcus marinus CUG1431]|uniref:Sulfotransferase n=1 Tax=Prochlorococcus marinus CUG1433 TaxID=2774506 RepID=A0A9D9G0L5_PROMR|nr:sulfotransferase [Prochlorococcus marinus CUG1433]MBO6980044.1 sulfotransferase [Prochlorococcus marinus CUG1431]